jgi:hypothetical protein
MTEQERFQMPKPIARALRPLVLVVFLCFSTLPLMAQFDTGTIRGTVTDSSGAAIPNAKVTATNVGTGIDKSTATDSNGSYTISAVPYGNYVVKANSTGFAEAKTAELVLSVGAIVRANLSLAVAGTEQKVDVTGTATSVDTESTQTGTTLNSHQIANLPVNGRDVSNFLEIAQGSSSATGYFQGSINGLENIFSGLNVTVDGQNASRGDINGFLMTEGQEQARVTRASIDSIQEIDFTNSGYSAEKGYSLGPQMNIVTKSGTNQFHGTAFYFLRNDALDSRDYFNRGDKAPLRLNQYGGNLGGPIIKNKLFFFANYEGDVTNITNFNSLYQTPSAYIRSLPRNPAMDPVFAQLAPLPSSCNTIPAPASCAVPGTEDPANPLMGAQLVYLPAALPNHLKENTGSIKVDLNMSDRDHIFFRYNINDSLTNYTYGLNQGQVSPQSLRTQLLKVEETHTFSPSFLNQFSVGYNRFLSNTASNTGQPYVGFSGFFVNLGSLPAANLYNQNNAFNVFEVFDNLTKVFNKHTLKFGVQFRHNQLNEFLHNQQIYYYGSFSDLLANNPFVLNKIGFPGSVGVVNSNWGFYAQDDWKVTRNLTLNLGLRYDFNTTWSERQNNAQNFDYATQSFLPANQPLYNAPKADFAPRVGFAWDMFGTGKTVMHGYGGMFYMPMQFGYNLVGNIPAYQSYSVTVFDAIFANPPFSISYPAPNPPLPAGTQNVTIFPQNPRDPLSTNWLFGVQHEILPATILSVNYTGNKTQHMQAGVSFAALNLNPQNPVTGTRPLTGYASENLFADTLYSTYNALQVQLKHNQGRLNYELNYTWSHEIDDLVNVFSGWSNPFNPNQDRASGDWDVRHNLTGSVVYNFADWKGGNGFGKALLNGWQVSSILQTRTGLPTNVQLISGFFGLPMRPNYVPGVNTNGSANWPNGNYNLNAFAVPPGYNGEWGAPENIGTVGRNALRGPGFFQWDFSAMKNFQIKESVKLQFRTDVFNILNHPNFANPDAGICTAVTAATPTTPASCTPNPNFGVTGQTIADNVGTQIGTGTSRQIQFALKLIF